VTGRSDEARPLCAVVLAAGQGTRMRSRLVKVLHPLAGRPMIGHVIHAVRGIGAERIVCVVGYQREEVRDALETIPEVGFAVQEEQLGTGHALECAAPSLDSFDGDVLVCCGDTPLLTDATLRRLVDAHRNHGAPATVLAAVVDDPTGYGRVVTSDGTRVRAIVEERDADARTRTIDLVNTGVFCFAWREVRSHLERLSPDNEQGERYLTDVMGILAREGSPGVAVRLDDPAEMAGVNDRRQLAEAEAVLRRRIRDDLMRSGVTMLDPSSTWIDADVAIGPDTVLYPGVLLEGSTSVGRESVIGPFTRIVDSHVGRGAELQGWNHLVRTTVPDGAIVSPYVRRGGG